jgi:ribose transport system substrate-binding protein
MAARPVLRRRPLLAGLLASRGLGFARAEVRRFRIAFANLDETPGVTLEGLGFTGAEMRRSFELAARTLPVDLVYFDNAGEPARAVTNADAAVAAHVAAAGIPALALVDPLPGAPLYGPDNRTAGHIAGRALGGFARETWPDEQVLGVLIGDLADPGSVIGDRVQGITDGAHESLPMLKFASLDTGGQSVRADALLAKFLQVQRGQRLLIATLDDLAAVYARNAIEMNRRQSDCVIVSQGLDRNIHGGASEKKEIDPNNRGSVVLGSVAYYMHRYGYDVLPLALRLLAGETLPPRTVTQHVLVTGANVFREYPPFDMN